MKTITLQYFLIFLVNFSFGQNEYFEKEYRTYFDLILQDYFNPLIAQQHNLINRSNYKGLKIKRHIQNENSEFTYSDSIINYINTNGYLDSCMTFSQWGIHTRFKYDSLNRMVSIEGIANKPYSEKKIVWSNEIKYTSNGLLKENYIDPTSDHWAIFYDWNEKTLSRIVICKNCDQTVKDLNNIPDSIYSYAFKYNNNKIQNLKTVPNQMSPFHFNYISNTNFIYEGDTLIKLEDSGVNVDNTLLKYVHNEFLIDYFPSLKDLQGLSSYFIYNSNGQLSTRISYKNNRYRIYYYEYTQSGLLSRTSEKVFFSKETYGTEKSIEEENIFYTYEYF